MKDYHGKRIDELPEMNSALFQWETHVLKQGWAFSGVDFQNFKNAWILGSDDYSKVLCGSFVPVGYTRNVEIRPMRDGIKSWGLMCENDDGERAWVHIFDPDAYNAAHPDRMRSWIKKQHTLEQK